MSASDIKEILGSLCMFTLLAGLTSPFWLPFVILLFAVFVEGIKEIVTAWRGGK